MRKILTATMAVAALAVAGTAGALTASTTFGVSATVLKTCSVGANPLGFGNYTPAAGALTANTTVNVKCTKGTTFSVALNGGSTTGGTITQRLMSNGTDTLQYNLYTTAALATCSATAPPATRCRARARDWRARSRSRYLAACRTMLPTRRCRPAPTPIRSTSRLPTDLRSVANH